MKNLTQLTGISLFAVAITIGGVLSSCKQTTPTPPAEQVFRFSAIPDENTTAQKERYAPVAKWLSEQLEIDVEFIPSSGYPASVDKFETGDIQMAWFGGVTGVQARNAVPNSQAIVSGAKDLQFKSYFIANASTGLSRSDSFPKEIKNLTFTFGDAGSTSGCIMPAYFIMKNADMGPLAFFSQKVGFSGSHDKTALQVQNGVYQTGAMNYSTYDQMVKDQKIDPEKCRIIWETPAYADYNFTVRANLDDTFGQGFTKKLQKLLIECNDPAVLKAFNRAKFVKVDNNTFQGIADVVKKVKLK